jgi:MerR family copper efflux transcriptional regulator
MSNRRQTRASLELADAKRQGLHNIGEAAAATGVSAKMIRHYEAIGLIPPANRTFANYRVYTDKDLHTLRFIKRARTLGFSMKQIEQLLGLWQDRGRASSKVKQLALGHIAELEAKVQEMQSMINTLTHLAHNCHGDARPDCPILEELAVPHDHAGCKHS